MNNETNNKMEKLNKIMSEARNYFHNEAKSKTWEQKNNTRKVSNLRKRFRKEAEKIGWTYTFDDCLA